MLYKVVITDRGYDEDYHTIASIEKIMLGLGVDCIISLDPEDAANCDGIIAPGAPPDVDPALYGEENTGCGEIDRELDDKRLAMIDAAVKAGRPVMGICAGMQLVNVYFGGTLVQDIERRDTHHVVPYDYRLHTVYNLSGTVFHMLFGDSGIVNSAHHQAVKKLGDGLEATQLWLSNKYSQEEKDEWIWKLKNDPKTEVGVDCMIEAFVHKTLPIVGIQHHPEMVKWQEHPGTLDPIKPFEYFAYLVRREARKRAENK